MIKWNSDFQNNKKLDFFPSLNSYLLPSLPFIDMISFMGVKKVKEWLNEIQTFTTS